MAETRMPSLGPTFCKPTSKIDVHTHISKVAAPNRFTAEERIAFNKVMDISKSVLLPSAEKGMSELGFTEEQLKGLSAPLLSEDAYAVCQQYPDHFAWMCNIYLDGTDAPHEKLKRYKAMGACGVGEFAQRLRFDDPQMKQLFGWLQELGMPFLFHMSPDGKTYGVVDEPGLPLLEDALRKFPKLKFIGHSQPFWFEISTYPPDLTTQERNVYPSGKVIPGRLPYLMQTYDNLYADLSADSAGNAIMRDPDYGLEFLNTFQDKLMYGSDTATAYFHYPMGAYLDSLLHQLKLNPEVYTKICCTNAQRILNL